MWLDRKFDGINEQICYLELKNLGFGFGLSLFKPKSRITDSPFPPPFLCSKQFLNCNFFPYQKSKIYLYNRIKKKKIENCKKKRKERG